MRHLVQVEVQAPKRISPRELVQLESLLAAAGIEGISLSLSPPDAVRICGAFDLDIRGGCCCPGCVTLNWFYPRLGEALRLLRLEQAAVTTGQLTVLTNWRGEVPK